MSNAEAEQLATARLDDILRIGNVAVTEAQERSRRAGVPNVYEIDGVVYYETPTGELSTTDPWQEPGGEDAPAR